MRVRIYVVPCERNNIVSVYLNVIALAQTWPTFV